jgi:hypothetical protein
LATVAAITPGGTMVVHLDEAGEIGVTLQSLGRPDPPTEVYAVEVQGWGFERLLDRPPNVMVRARCPAEAVRRAAGAVLLIYDGETTPYG